MDTEQMPDTRQRYALDVLVFDAHRPWPESRCARLVDHVHTHPNVRSLGIAHRLEQVADCLRDGRVNTLIVGLQFTSGDIIPKSEKDETPLQAVAQFIVRVRRELPTVVFVLYADKFEFRNFAQ